MARILFVILLALNLGALTWQLTRPVAPEVMFAATDPGVPGLVLLRERDRAAMQESASLAAAQAQQAEQPKPPSYCETLGPFVDRPAAQVALGKLQPLTQRTQVRQNKARIVRGYWVHVPVHDSRAEALATARQLAAAGVRDYYVVTAGEQENTISLGLFRDQENAAKRRDQVAAMGFRARVIERADEQEQFWIDYQSRDDKPVDWRKALGEAGTLTATQVLCF